MILHTQNSVKVNAAMGYIFSFLVVLLPLLGQVGLPIDIPFVTENISVGELVLIPFIVGYLCDKWPVDGITALRPVRLGGTVCFAILLTAVSIVGARTFGFSLRTALPTVFSLFFFAALMLAVRGNFRARYGIWLYSDICFLLSLYLLLQLLLLKNGYGYLTDGFVRDSYIFAGIDPVRFADTGVPTSLFLSADAFALFVIPAVIFCLLWNRRCYSFFGILYGAFMTAAVIVSGSAIGTVIVSLIWVAYLALPLLYFILHPADAVYRFTRSGAPKITVLVLFYMIAVTLVTLYLLDGTLSRVLLPSFREVLHAPSLTAGFTELADVLVTRRQLFFGVGFGNIEAAFASAGIALPALSSFGVLLYSTGLVGLAAFSLLLVGLLLRSRGKFGFAIALLLIAVSLISDVAYTPIFMLWFFLSHTFGQIEMPFKRYLRIEY